MSNQAIAVTRDFAFNDNRLPYVPDLADAFGVDNVRWRVLINAVYPNASSVASVIMALTYCKARNLDVFKRPVHIVPMWSSAAKDGKGGMIDTIWPGIAELRTTAFRTGQCAGIDAVEFGPIVEQKFKFKDAATPEVSVRFPVWAQVTIYRMVAGQRCQFVGPRVYWIEAYAKANRDAEAPNDMWRKRPNGQIEKCAEAAALRRAFPEEIGSDYAAEEMEGHALEGDRAARAVAPPVQASALAIENKPALSIVPAKESAPATVADAAAGEPAARGVASASAGATPSGQRKPPMPPAAAAQNVPAAFDRNAHKLAFLSALGAATTPDEVDDLFAKQVQNIVHNFNRDQFLELKAFCNKRIASFEPQPPEMTWDE